MKERLFLRNRGDGDYFLESRTENSAAVVASLNPDHELEGKLSLRNCEAVVNGYDLDELVNEEFYKFDQEVRIVYRRQLQESLTNMFQKALEILRDKKFNEKDMIAYGWFVELRRGTTMHHKMSNENGFYLGEYIQSLQQTEWEVTYNPNEKDVDGCLILKRV